MKTHENFRKDPKHPGKPNATVQLPKLSKNPQRDIFKSKKEKSDFLKKIYIHDIHKQIKNNRRPGSKGRRISEAVSMHPG